MVVLEDLDCCVILLGSLLVISDERLLIDIKEQVIHEVFFVFRLL